MSHPTSSDDELAPPTKVALRPVTVLSLAAVLLALVWLSFGAAGRGEAVPAPPAGLNPYPATGALSPLNGQILTDGSPESLAAVEALTWFPGGALRLAVRHADRRDLSIRFAADDAMKLLPPDCERCSGVYTGRQLVATAMSDLDTRTTRGALFLPNGGRFPPPPEARALAARHVSAHEWAHLLDDALERDRGEVQYHSQTPEFQQLCNSLHPTVLQRYREVWDDTSEKHLCIEVFADAVTRAVVTGRDTTSSGRREWRMPQTLDVLWSDARSESLPRLDAYVERLFAATG